MLTRSLLICFLIVCFFTGVQSQDFSLRVVKKIPLINNDLQEKATGLPLEKLNSDANLICTDIRVSSVVWYSGNEIEITIFEKNIGTLSASSHRTQVYLSRNLSISEDDYMLSPSLSFPSIRVGSIISSDRTYNVPNGIPDGTYILLVRLDSEGDVLESDEENDYAGQGSITIKHPPSLPAIEMTLHRISDLSGSANTSNPGIAKTNFHRGETVRITFKAKNKGYSAPAIAVLNIRNTDNTTLVYDSHLLGQDNSTDFPLQYDETDYFSFDWNIPGDASAGMYDIGGSMRNMDNFDILYETTLPGEKTGFENGWMLDNVFSCQGISPTFLDALAELANLRVAGDLKTLYGNHKKTLAYVSGSFSPGIVSLFGVDLYIDLNDYYSSSHPENPITEEGAMGWITMWIDGHLNPSVSVLPIGIGIASPLPFEPPEEDPKREWNLSLLSASIPFLKTTIVEWSDDGFDWGLLSLNPQTNFSGEIFSLGRNVTRFEIQRNKLDEIFDKALKNGSNTGVLNDELNLNNASSRILTGLIELIDWKVMPSQIVRPFTTSDHDQSSATVIDGVLNHVVGGFDTNLDGVPDNRFPIMPTFFGLPYESIPTDVTFQNIGTETADFFVKVINVPNGWWIGAIDNDLLVPLIDNKVDKPNVSPLTEGDNSFVTTRWAIAATEGAPEMAIIEFELYHDGFWANELLDTVVDTIYKYTTSEVQRGDSQAPISFSLAQNYPNPFNPSTNLSFEISTPSFVQLEIFNILGENVTTLIQGELLDVGTYRVTWDAADSQSGTYYCRFSTIGYVDRKVRFSQTRKLMLIK